MAKPKTPAKTKKVELEKLGFSTGFEAPDLDVIQIPRVKIVQRTSDEMDEGIPYLSLVNSVTKEVLSKATKTGTSVEIIPIKYTKNRLRFAPMDEGGGLLCMSRDGKVGNGDPGGKCAGCSYKDWVDDKVECTQVINFFSLVRGEESLLPFAIGFSKMSMKAGRQLYNIIFSKAQAGYAPFQFAYELSTHPEKNDKGAFGIFKITPAGEATPDEVEKAVKMGELMEKAIVEVHNVAEAVEDDEAFSE